MHHRFMLMRCCSYLALGAALLAPAAASAAAKVGTTAAVNPQTTGTPPGASPRVLMIGNDVEFEERIETSGVGQTQILFLDQSSLTLGPNASVVLDRFVYSPDTGGGELALSVTKGVFRFIGGRISSGPGATIKTPVATLGIRGTAVFGTVGEGGPGDQGASNRFIFASCGQQCSITTGAQTVSFGPSANGSMYTIGGGQRIQYLGKATNADIKSITTPLEGSGGGGAPQPPTTNQVQQGLAQGAPSDSFAPVSVDPQLSQQTSSGAQQTVVQVDQQSDIQDTISNQASDSASDSSQSPPPPSAGYSGRYYSSFDTRGPVGTTFQPGDVKRAFNDGRIVTDPTTGAQQFRADSISYASPLQPGTFPIDPSNTESEFGPLAGGGFFDPAARFGLYIAEEIDFPGYTSALFFGIPLPDPLLLGPSPRPFSVSTYALTEDPHYQVAIPFLRETGGGDISGAFVSNLYTATRPLPATANALSTGLQASLGISGQGAGQNSVLAGYTGRFFTDSEGQVAFGGGFVGSARFGSGNLTVFSQGGVETVPAGETGPSRPAGSGGRFFGDNSEPPIKYFVLSNDFSVNGTYTEQTAFEQRSDFRSNPGASEFGTNYGYLHLATRAETPTNIGQTRTSRPLTGYAAALGETNRQNTGGGGNVLLPPYALGNQTNSPDDVSITTNAETNRLQATFNLNDKFGTSGNQTASPPTSPVVASASFQFGGLTTSNTARSSFIDDNIFAARDNPETASVVNGKATASDNFGFASPGVMVSQAVVPTTNFPPAGVTFCDCQYLEWGYWSYEFRFPDASGADAGRRDRIHLGSWVVGELADPIAGFANKMGTASYTGHAVGNVYNNGSQYVAAGNFSKTWNFDTRTGSAKISNFDGATYDFSTGGANKRDFTGSLTPTSAATTGRSAELAGSLFKGGNNPAAEVGGRFSIGSRSSTYRAAGTFAGKEALGQ